MILRIRLFGLGLALLTLLALPSSRAAEPDAKKSSSSSRTPSTASPAPPVSRESVSRIIEDEQKIYLQRLAICDRLRAIAEATDDDALREKAAKLEEMAFEVYMEKYKKIPVVLGDAKGAEAALERRPTQPAVSRGPAGSPSTPTRAPNGRPITNRERN